MNSPAVGPRVASCKEERQTFLKHFAKPGGLDVLVNKRGLVIEALWCQL